jgi:hypothetical protein
MRRLLCLVVLLWGSVGAAADLPALIEADWAAQDRLKGGGFALAHTREVIERGARLLADFKGAAGLETRLRDVERRLRESESRGNVPEEARRALHFEARRVVREIAFCNPLLDFDRLLFVARHPGRFAHMCDQYYGTYARAGGGLFVLEDVWTRPRLRNVVGRGLPEGSFLSPDLSYDGKTILFAWCQAQEAALRGFDPVFRSDADALRHGRWTAEVRYHVYRVNLDGTGLQQLTDGPHDDFDPCWLPDGDIAFVSTRRGGFCRCGGRPVPAYTLHRMNAPLTQPSPPGGRGLGEGGSGLRRLSHHETNEWHPAVARDGRLLYTRWDYVDRHTNLAHSVWSTNPDGTDALAVFGNYSTDRKPWGEWHPQPVPGSPKIVAVAGAHHGYAFGSLVLIDPVRGRDGLASITRLTPDVAFPEAEGWPRSAFTTPWPLSEKYYLASYSPDWSTRDATHKVTQGIYLLDCFGNRELLYRDPMISALDPIPLKPRPRPPARSRATAASGEGEFLVVDARPHGTAGPKSGIKSLRVVQVLPKTTYRSDEPKISAARQVSARMLLGTVPVEADGSAYFKAPAGVPLYFQTVDGDRLAYQSMRTITYLQPGEKRGCSGCHEPGRASAPNRLPRAALRPPSRIEPGPDGTQPFSFLRLVQPVLDRHCARCHNPQQPAGKVVLTGRFTRASEPYTESYRSLTRADLVHVFNSTSGSEWEPRTRPGEFGARRSKLIQLLQKEHHGLQLDRDSLARLALWVDLNVPFYGVYEPAHVAAQREGKDVPLGEIAR